MESFTLRCSSPLHDAARALAARFSSAEGTVFLYSGGDRICAQNSYLALYPEEEVVASDWDEIKTLLSRDLSEERQSSLPLWIGYFAYEMGEKTDSSLVIPMPSPPIPRASFIRHALLIHFDHSSDVVTLHLRGKVPAEVASPSYWEKLLANATPFHEELSFTSTPVASSDSYEDYLNKIALFQEAIRDGEIYQACLSQEFLFRYKGHPYAFFDALAQRNPCSFSAYLQYDTFTIASSSPERLLSCTNGILETRPIKGTAPRGENPEDDRRIMEELLASEKERAELLMITDLMRNDLARVSEIGSVKTEKIWSCEAYTDVFHLVSTVTSKLKQDIHPVEAVRACFPGGSISGCPKLRAMELISRTEKRARHIYTGSIGYFAANGDFDFNIAIRTALLKDETLSVQLGGAVVIDSNPTSEYEETLHKGGAIFDVLGCSERLHCS